MNIRPEIYRALIPRQRIIATIDAMARNDTNEVDRLNKTCDHKNYKLPDTKYSNVMIRIFETSLAVESDLRGIIIDYLETDTGIKQKQYIQQISNINAAWLELLDGMGIDKESIAQVVAPRHQLINTVLNISPQPEENAKNEILNIMKEHINA